MLPSFIFFNGLLGYLRTYATDLYQTLRIGRPNGRHDKCPTFFSDRSRDVVLVTDFWHGSAKIGISHFYSMQWHSTTDRKIETWMRVLTPPMTTSTGNKNSVNFDPVTLEFCRRVCAGRAILWALPRISSSVLSLRRHHDRAGTAHLCWTLFKSCIWNCLTSDVLGRPALSRFLGSPSSVVKVALVLRPPDRLPSVP